MLCACYTVTFAAVIPPILSIQRCSCISYSTMCVSVCECVVALTCAKSSEQVLLCMAIFHLGFMYSIFFYLLCFNSGIGVKYFSTHTHYALPCIWLLVWPPCSIGNAYSRILFTLFGLPMLEFKLYISFIHILLLLVMWFWLHSHCHELVPVNIP